MEFKGIEEEEEEIAEERSSAEGEKDKGELNVSEFPVIEWKNVKK